MRTNRREFVIGLGSLSAAPLVGGPSRAVGAQVAEPVLHVDGGIGYSMSADGEVMTLVTRRASWSGLTDERVSLFRIDVRHGFRLDARALPVGDGNHEKVTTALREADARFAEVADPDAHILVSDLFCDFDLVSRGRGMVVPELFKRRMFDVLRPGAREVLSRRFHVDGRALSVFRPDRADTAMAHRLGVAHPWLAHCVEIEGPRRDGTSDEVWLDRWEVTEDASGFHVTHSRSGETFPLPAHMVGRDWDSTTVGFDPCYPVVRVSDMIDVLLHMPPGEVPRDQVAWTALAEIVSGMGDLVGLLRENDRHLGLRDLVARVPAGSWDGLGTRLADLARAGRPEGAAWRWHAACAHALASFGEAVLGPLLRRIDPVAAGLLFHADDEVRAYHPEEQGSVLMAEMRLLWGDLTLPEIVAMSARRSPTLVRSVDEDLEVDERAMAVAMFGSGTDEGLPAAMDDWAPDLPEGFGNVDRALAHPVVTRLMADVRRGILETLTHCDTTPYLDKRTLPKDYRDEILARPDGRAHWPRGSSELVDDRIARLFAPESHVEAVPCATDLDPIMAEDVASEVGTTPPVALLPDGTGTVFGPGQRVG